MRRGSFIVCTVTAKDGISSKPSLPDFGEGGARSAPGGVLISEQAATGSEKFFETEMLTPPDRLRRPPSPRSGRDKSTAHFPFSSFGRSSANPTRNIARRAVSRFSQFAIIGLAIVP